MNFGQGQNTDLFQSLQLDKFMERKKLCFDEFDVMWGAIQSGANWLKQF